MSSAAQLNIAKSSSQLRRDARTLQAFMALKAQEIGERISQLRDAKGNPPQPRVAAAIGVSLRTYQSWEAGEARPQYHNLEALAEYYGTTEEYILTGSAAVASGGTARVEITPAQAVAPAGEDLADRLDRIDQRLERIEHLLKSRADVRPELAELLEAFAATLPEAPGHSERKDSQEASAPQTRRRRAKAG